jgi:hypothetical protein
METEYSISAFRRFLDTLHEASDINEATARNLKSTSNLLLSSYVDGIFTDETDDVREIDTDKLINEHFKDAITQPSSSTLQVYKSRYTSSLDKFLDYVDGDSSMNNDHEESVEQAPLRARRKRVPRDFSQPVSVLNGVVRGDTETIDIPIPLRPGVILTLPGIPTDLTNEEAERIASILKVYARPQ